MDFISWKHAHTNLRGALHIHITADTIQKVYIP